MRVSVAWLRELLPGLDAPASEIAERLTRAGLEVEAQVERGAGLEPVVVAEVRSVEPHPTRSGLRLVTVNRGAGHEQRVVCGAPNVPDPGGLVVLAPLGTTLAAKGLTLTAREIGGVVSEGMLCSEAELGLGDDQSGILVLAAGMAAAGTPLASALPAHDWLLEIGVTPNRPDALGHVGVARELSALYSLPFALPTVPEAARTAAQGIDALIAVDNREPDRCPHYGAAAVLDVTVGPSPLALRWRLSSLGIRPISNVVDLTNLILLLYGQPMHAFDLDRVRGSASDADKPRIVVRCATPGEPFATLDGTPRKLEADDLVIADGERPSALAGVMGGADSEIRADTRRVLLECAYFAPRGIRRSARRHGLHTESSHRFERGVDWGALPHVLDHAAAWLAELGGGALAPGRVHARGTVPSLPTARLRSARLDALVGAPVPFDEAAAVLARLGFGVAAASGSGADAELRVTGASWRPDVTSEADLIEEVARVRGLDRIPTLLPAIRPQEPRTSSRMEREVVSLAAQLGLSEAVTYAFVSPRELAALHAPEAVVKLAHPLTDERSVMRTSLLPGLLEALRRARRQGERAVRLFTVGARYVRRSDAAPGAAVRAARPRRAGDEVLPDEPLSFAALLAGPRTSYLAAPSEVDVFDAKGVALELVERLVGRSAELRPTRDADHRLHLHPRGTADIFVDGTLVGSLGPLHPDVVAAFDLEGPAQAVELDLDVIESQGLRQPRYRPIPRLPAVTRDLAVTVREDVAAGEVQRIIVEAAGELCESVELFDLFRGGSVPAGQRSLAFRVVYRDPRAAAQPEAARTLTDREVDERHAGVVRAANEKVGAQLRA